MSEAIAVDDDPFAAVVYTSGIEIDLTAPQAELSVKLKELIAMEASLARRGVTCPLKDNGQDCLSCPSATLDQHESRSKLCRVGKDEATVWAAGEARQSERMAPVMEMAAIAEEMSEIGHIPAELAELALSAGL